MSLLGSSRDDRRRRTLAEDSANESAQVVTSMATPKPSGKSERYAAAGRRDHHRRMSDLIPRSIWSLGIWFLVGLTLTGGLLCAYAFMADFSIADAAGTVPLFDATKSDSLVGWFSSFIFLLAAITSTLVYSIRRHKVDDYRRRYRLWLWCAAAWMVMSIDATANLHTPFSQTMVHLTGWSPLGKAESWSVAVWGTILLTLAARLILEVRQSSAGIAFGAAFLLWTTSTATDHGLITVGPQIGLVTIGCKLFGDLTLLLAIGTYARFVLLDAEGLIEVRMPKPPREKPVKKAKASKASSDVEDAAEEKSVRIDAAQKPLEKRTDLQSVSAKGEGSASVGQNRNPVRRFDDDEADSDRFVSLGANQNRYTDDHDEYDSSGGDRKLSKAERKRLRRLKRQEERDAA